MPTLETADGSAVDVTPVDPAAVNAAFDTAMNDTGPDASAPPKRTPAEVAEQPKRGRGRPPKVPKAEQARTTPAKPVTALDDVQRAQGVKGVVQLVGGGALMAAKVTENPAFIADAVTISGSADQWADACVDIARSDPKFAAALDKVCASGPRAVLVSLMVGTGLQLLRNHRPAMQLPGTVHPDKLMKEVTDVAVPAAA